MTDVTLDLSGARWTPPEPRELPEWRAELLEYTRGKDSKLSLAQAINAGRAAVFPTVAGVGASEGSVASLLLSREEEQRLADAALYYVTPDMTALAIAAASTPPTEPVSESRLPAPQGFMLFAEPIGGYTQDVADVLQGPMGRDGAHAMVTTPIVAVSWGMWGPGAITVTGAPPVRWFNQHDYGTLRPIPPDFQGVWLTFYAPSGSALDGLSPETVIGSLPDGSPMTAGHVQGSNPLTRLNWDNETALAFGLPFGEPEPDTTKEWAQVVYTAWQLMAQTGRAQLAEVEEVPRERAGRKRDARAGITGDPGVRIVHVHSAHRPPAAATADDAESSTGRRAPQWSCRWPVRPYRRNTCLNPRVHADGGCTHEDRIVPPHIKGPGDKPLRLGETVNLWDAQP